MGRACARSLHYCTDCLLHVESSEESLLPYIDYVLLAEHELTLLPAAGTSSQSWICCLNTTATDPGS
eukprot:12473-Heterococcus_DN1.PRE.3